MQVASPHFLYIDLFAGCGGISLGLCNAGWQGLFAIEKSAMAFETFKHNLLEKENHFRWPLWLPVAEHDIIDVIRDYEQELKGLQGKVDLLVGGPPCQGFSVAGRRNESDERNTLAKSYIRFVEFVRPRIVFFENVLGFTIGFKKDGERRKPYSHYVEEELRKLGYFVKGDVVDFSEFGIPQRRKRFILVGMLAGDPEAYFKEIMEKRRTFLKNKGLSETVSLCEAISDLERKHGERPSRNGSGLNEGNYGEIESAYQKWMRRRTNKMHPDSHRFAKHNKKTIERWTEILANCPKNVALSSHWKKKYGLRKKTTVPLDSNSTCPTLTTLPDDCIHYSEPRILTVREYARIQSFEDSYEILGKYTTGGKRRKSEVPRYTQIGNAVPPLFAELSGEVFKEMF